MNAQTAPVKIVFGSLVKIAGDTWKVIGVGVTREDGAVYCHTASTTRFSQRRNGRCPVQECRWLVPGEYAIA